MKEEIIRLAQAGEILVTTPTPYNEPKVPISARFHLSNSPRPSSAGRDIFYHSVPLGRMRGGSLRRRPTSALLSRRKATEYPTQRMAGTPHDRPRDVVSCRNRAQSAPSSRTRQQEQQQHVRKSDFSESKNQPGIIGEPRSTTIDRDTIVKNPDIGWQQTAAAAVELLITDCEKETAVPRSRPVSTTEGWAVGVESKKTTLELKEKSVHAIIPPTRLPERYHVFSDALTSKSAITNSSEDIVTRNGIVFVRQFPRHVPDCSKRELAIFQNVIAKMLKELPEVEPLDWVPELTTLAAGSTTITSGALTAKVDMENSNNNIASTIPTQQVYSASSPPLAPRASNIASNSRKLPETFMASWRLLEEQRSVLDVGLFELGRQIFVQSTNRGRLYLLLIERYSALMTSMFNAFTLLRRHTDAHKASVANAVMDAERQAEAELEQLNLIARDRENRLVEHIEMLEVTIASQSDGITELHSLVDTLKANKDECAEESKSSDAPTAPPVVHTSSNSLKNNIGRKHGALLRGVSTEIAEGSKSAEQLAEDLRCHQQMVRLIMRRVVSLTAEGDGVLSEAHVSSKLHINKEIIDGAVERLERRSHGLAASMTDLEQQLSDERSRTAELKRELEKSRNQYVAFEARSVRNAEVFSYHRDRAADQGRFVSGRRLELLGKILELHAHLGVSSDTKAQLPSPDPDPFYWEIEQTLLETEVIRLRNCVNDGSLSYQIRSHPLGSLCREKSIKNYDSIPRLPRSRRWICKMIERVYSSYGAVMRSAQLMGRETDVMEPKFADFVYNVMISHAADIDSADFITLELVHSLNICLSATPDDIWVGLFQDFLLSKRPPALVLVLVYALAATLDIEDGCCPFPVAIELSYPAWIPLSRAIYSLSFCLPWIDASVVSALKCEMEEISHEVSFHEQRALLAIANIDPNQLENCSIEKKISLEHYCIRIINVAADWCVRRLDEMRSYQDEILSTHSVDLLMFNRFVERTDHTLEGSASRIRKARLFRSAMQVDGDKDISSETVLNIISERTRAFYSTLPHLAYTPVLIPSNENTIRLRQLANHHWSASLSAVLDETVVALEKLKNSPDACALVGLLTEARTDLLCYLGDNDDENTELSYETSHTMYISIALRRLQMLLKSAFVSFLLPPLLNVDISFIEREWALQRDLISLYADKSLKTVCEKNSVGNDTEEVKRYMSFEQRMQNLLRGQ